MQMNQMSEAERQVAWLELRLMMAQREKNFALSRGARQMDLLTRAGFAKKTPEQREKISRRLRLAAAQESAADEMIGVLTAKLNEAKGAPEGDAS